MRRLLVSLCLVCGIVLSLSGLVSAQTAPTFKLGFLALAQQIPDVVGEPLENEHWGANGDSLQQTTKGLMVWRKADNWTAFTDGARTWINGRYGVQMRWNNERFVWEGDPQGIDARTPEQKAADAAAADAFAREAADSWANTFTLRIGLPYGRGGMAFGTSFTNAPDGYNIVGSKDTFKQGESMAVVFLLPRGIGATRYERMWSHVQLGGESVVNRQMLNVADPSSDSFAAWVTVPSWSPGRYALRIIVREQVLVSRQFEIE